MRWISMILILVVFTTCARISNFKKMTIRGTAVTGIATTTPVSLGNVQLLVPGQSGWERVVFDEGSDIPNIVTTATDGSYTIEVEFNWWEEVFISEDRPVFLSISDIDGTFTLLNQVPIDLVGDGNDITLNPTPQTTVAAMWQCPHGIFASPQPSCPPNAICSSRGGSPCYQLPAQSTTTTDMVNLIDASVTNNTIADPDPTNFAAFSATLLDADNTILAKITANYTEKGFTIDVDINSAFFGTEFGVNAVPFIPLPTSDDLNDPTTSTGGGSGNEICTSFFNCPSCNISACSDGDRTWYRTSTGTDFFCASNGNCTSAASAVLSACGCTSRDVLPKMNKVSFLATHQNK